MHVSSNATPNGRTRDCIIIVEQGIRIPYEESKRGRVLGYVMHDCILGIDDQWRQ
jgi:hypothetical protein